MRRLISLAAAPRWARPAVVGLRLAAAVLEGGTSCLRPKRRFRRERTDQYSSHLTREAGAASAS
ncbi:MAG: hypothetical protein E5X53_12560 [Mesorhizobium sp.]|nr:MAG: hypothetical protein EOR73_13760 [Mesorhizobium sp.]TIP74287.1 MAG: hypothetical protein E5X55_10430 [Mesorhizobium sp.]TIQ12835.1 MAG: hypothetical protein E5X57_11070 [Mesorhizobium sp.]TIR51869.1 MAG: hypothetical protein E5X53_12560 [Mesorhizobium sp.]TJV98868.1 MAG: hypothetical protein E5X52_06455 [Mesorhizobium sp.]